MSETDYQIGVIGLGVMGRNLLLNIADHGFSAAGYDKDTSKVRSLRREAERRKIQALESLDDFIRSLRRPRAIILLVPAGPPVDSVLSGLLSSLVAGDAIVDGGNSHFRDTDRRMKMLSDKGIHFLGTGISGGEHGARHGPSIMPGGAREAYDRVRDIFEAIAARANGEACVAYLGSGSAGHYVKMVHNGIEYGLMQLIAETYHLMKQGLGLSNEELHRIYQEWNESELKSYLIEITAHIFTRREDETGVRLIDLILDKAGQKGTGMWTSQDALDLGVPVPTIDFAVAMRNLSGLKSERETASRAFLHMTPTLDLRRQAVLNELQNALYLGMIIVYAQGFSQLRKASEIYGYNLNLAEVARIWRGGCIIRAALLEKIRAAYSSSTPSPNLLVDAAIVKEVKDREEQLRAVVGLGVQLGIPIGGFMASLSYLDGYRSAWLPANLIQAQRDYFGAHTYERVDVKGVFHTQWEER